MRPPSLPLSLLFPLLLAPALLVGCGPEPLAYSVEPVRIGYDASEVLDVVTLDYEGDGDIDLVAATADGLRLLVFDQGAWADRTLGTRLDVAEERPRWLLLDGRDLLLHPGDGDAAATVTRLVWEDTGTWAPAAEPAGTAAAIPVPDRPTDIEPDLDGDGVPDRAALVGHGLQLWRRGADGGLTDITARVGAGVLRLPAAGRRLRAADLDADGHLDLVAVGGRISALLSNGGALAAEAEARAGGNAEGGSAGAGGGARAGGAAGAGVGAGGTDGASTGRGGRSLASQPWFTDVTDVVGLAFTHDEDPDQTDIRPTMGPGAAWADVDGDGDSDLYVVGGRRQKGVLYRNEGPDRFTDVTQDVWLTGLQQSGMGASFADWDDDGDPDLYVTNDGANTMWRNDGDRFVDVTGWTGTGATGWSAGVAWADPDRDGDLDLYVTNYLEVDPLALPPEPEDPGRRREDPQAMLPYVFPGQADVFFRNNGDGQTFTDATEEAGLLAPEGKGLGAAFFDQDGDGWLDLYVVNDTTPNTLWHNEGDGTFTEMAIEVGLDDPRGGMGVDLADVDFDGDEDLVVTYWQLEPNALYRNNRVHPDTGRRFVPAFEDVAVPAGLARDSVGVVGWGTVFADLDNDGDADLLVANGYTSPDYETTTVCVGQPDQLFENVTGSRRFEGWHDLPAFELVPPHLAGNWFGAAWAGRGAAAADYDGDGDLDVALTSNQGPLVLLRNERGGRSLRVLPVGNGRSVPREAVGAHLALTFESGEVQHAWVRRGSSYLSGHERGVRFGLAGRAPASLRVDWPDGTSTHHTADLLSAVASGTLRLEQP